MGDDPVQASDLIGAMVLVGITYQPPTAEPWHVQVHGTVLRVDESVIEIERPGSTPFTLPPAPEAFSRADLGVYTLRSTGEEIQDPDYTSQFTVMVESDELPDDSS